LPKLVQTIIDSKNTIAQSDKKSNKTIYNVGKMQKNTKFSLEAQRPEQSTTATENSVFNDTVPQSDEKSNGGVKFSLEKRTEAFVDLVAVIASAQTSCAV